MTVKTKFGTNILLLTMLLVGILLVPAANAQEADKYNVTAEEAFTHANAHMIQFIMTNTTGFENWTGASIDSKALELYDINGQRLFYQFSVNKNNNPIGKICIGANKTLGQSVRLVQFDPKLLDSAEAMNKSIEIAKKEYPTGEIKSTKMVVYDYPEIGAMTVVEDKTIGVEHRIFVDAYTLDAVPDRPATKTHFGVWSIYEKISKNKIDVNLKKWQSSDELTKSIEQAANNNGININLPVSKEDIKKLSSGTAIVATTIEKDLGTPTVYLQRKTYYCQPASAQMLTKYYRDTKPSQDSIYSMMDGIAPNGVSNEKALIYYRASNGLNKPNSYNSSDVTFNKAVTEINNYRPFMSGTSTHARVCRGYKQVDSAQYLRICDPYPTSLGMAYWKAPGSENDRIYVGS